MGLLRSEVMKHGTLVLPPDRCRELIDLVGRRTALQVTDMNASSMQRAYNKYIQRIEECERILRFLQEEIDRLPQAAALLQGGKTEEFLGYDEEYSLDKVEESLTNLHSQFTKFRDNNLDLVRQRNLVLEQQCVVQAALNSLAPTEGDEAVESLLSEGNFEDTEAAFGGPSAMHFSNISGVLPLCNLDQFSRTVFRATRGNAFTHTETISKSFQDERSGKEVSKAVAVVHFQGGRQSFLYERVMKICDAFGFKSYPWPKSHSEAINRGRDLDGQLREKNRAVAAYDDFVLGEIAVLLEVTRPDGNSLIEDWRLFCIKEKSIYATLNMFETSDSTLRADVWFPEQEEDATRRMLYHFSDKQTASAFLLTDKHETKKAPPTYNRVTKFTASFQGMIDTYGVPRYQEVNPALLTMVTFPFLFGVMYGDIGHGGCLCLASSWLLWNADKLSKSKNELVQMLVGGRYIIFMMSWFAFYAGFLYNDFFSLGLNLCGTRYMDGGDGPRPGQKVSIPSDSRPFPYPFGFDPEWKGALNEIVFFNSFKMKFSVIVGLVQMGAGVCNKALNAIHFKSHLDFFFEFVPQIIFLLCLVGYMDYLIVWKWVTGYSDAKAKTSIINLMIQMCMGGKVKDDMLLFPSQNVVQYTLLAIMAVCIPMMLLPKPLYLIHQHNHELKLKEAQLELKATEGIQRTGSVRKREESTSHDMEIGSVGRHSDDLTFDMSHDDEEEEFEVGEVLIHQMIETIEFCLGCISNTASYLRLWALSLAHQQLALVFFNNTILIALGMNNVIAMTFGLFIGFAVFAATTFGVLLCMDTLECFLHALRLQWVEYQSKFYKADGYAFTPLKFIDVLNGKGDE
eukprot:GHVN01024654.1.p1 GENE.GHVN01024654.1~~GHVN01024654.1.p1  ORF type:complete len:851 (-),score=147.66 GHVN01024654.1:264-2816(-)